MHNPQTGEVVLDPERQPLTWGEMIPDRQLKEILGLLYVTAEGQKDSSVYVFNQPHRPGPHDREEAFNSAERAFLFLRGSAPKRAYEAQEFFLFATRGRYGFGTFDHGVAVRRTTGEVLRWKTDERWARSHDRAFYAH